MPLCKGNTLTHSYLNALVYGVWFFFLIPHTKMPLCHITLLNLLSPSFKGALMFLSYLLKHGSPFNIRYTNMLLNRWKTFTFYTQMPLSGQPQTLYRGEMHQAVGISTGDYSAFGAALHKYKCPKQNTITQL